MRKLNEFIIIIYILIIIGLTTKNLFAQSDFIKQKFSVTFNNESLDTVIIKLQHLVDIGFSYNPEILIQVPRINKSFTNASLKDILDSIFISNQLSYDIIGRNIAIARFVKVPYPVKNIPVSELNIETCRISGRIIQIDSKNPVSFANVYIKNKSIGTISNSDGFFILKVPLESEDDSLYVSCLGYKTKSLLINQLSADKNIIGLTPMTVYIKEVDVKYIDPHKLIKEAIEKIPINYTRIALMNTAFYRETVRENNDYVSLSEAVLSIYKAPYNSYTSDQVYILKGRKSPFVKPMDTLYFKFQGGPYISLLLDIAKNPSNFLLDEYLEYYDFKLEEIQDIQDRPTYVISFDQKDNAPYSLFKGKLYIDRHSLAIVRADFMISPKGIDKAGEALVLKSPHKIKVKALLAKYLVNYKEQKNTWYLSNIREELAFRIHKKLTFFTRTYYAGAELVITKTDTTNVHRFRNHEIVRSSDIFVEKIGSYDETFWGEYNILKPDESLEEALKGVEHQIRTDHVTN